MNDNTAALKLVDRLTDVLLLRAGQSDKAVVLPGGIRPPRPVDYHNLPDRSAMSDARKVSDEKLKNAYYALLAAWEKTKFGPKPVKPYWMEAQEAAMRVSQAQSAPRGRGFHPSNH